jgi:hypothetical protein
VYICDKKATQRVTTRYSDYSIIVFSIDSNISSTSSAWAPLSLYVKRTSTLKEYRPDVLYRIARWGASAFAHNVLHAFGRRFNSQLAPRAYSPPAPFFDWDSFRSSSKTSRFVCDDKSQDRSYSYNEWFYTLQHIRGLVHLHGNGMRPEMYWIDLLAFLRYQLPSVEKFFSGHRCPSLRTPPPRTAT